MTGIKKDKIYTKEQVDKLKMQQEGLKAELDIAELKKKVIPLTDKDCAFLRLEYENLRQEILALKERVIKEFALGLTVIPVLFGSALEGKYYLLEVLGPIIVVCGYLMLLFEQNSIMRAGTYIGSFIEAHLLDHPALGWEWWLESYKGSRQAERFFHYSAASAFFIYYLVGIWLSWDGINKMGFPNLALPIVIIYGCCFLFAVKFVLDNFKTHSEYQTLKEREISSRVRFRFDDEDKKVEDEDKK